MQLQGYTFVKYSTIWFPLYAFILFVTRSDNAMVTCQMHNKLKGLKMFNSGIKLHVYISKINFGKYFPSNSPSCTIL